MPFESTLTEADVAEVHRMFEPHREAILSRDFDALLTLYTEDAVVLAPHSPPLVGRDAIKAWAASGPIIKSFEWTVEEIVGQGDMAFVRGRYKMSMEMVGLSEIINDKGSFIEIRQRQTDGKWLLARDIFNTDLPMPE